MKYKVKISNFVFGVPTSFMAYKYNPQQWFRILGHEHELIGGGSLAGFMINNSIVWKRLLIKFK